MYLHPFRQIDSYRFGVDYFMKRGYPTEIWRIINEKSIDFIPGGAVYQGENYHEYDYQEFKRQVGNHLRDIYILIGAGQVIYGEIIKRGCIYIFFDGMGGVFSLADAYTPKFPALLYKKLKRAFQRGIPRSLLLLYNMI